MLIKSRLLIPKVFKDIGKVWLTNGAINRTSVYNKIKALE